MINPDLSKLKCPECGSIGGFEVAIVCNSEVSEDGFPDIQLESWHVEPRSCCDCKECGHEGSIGEFLGEPPEEPADAPAPSPALLAFVGQLARMSEWEPGEGVRSPGDGIEDSHEALMRIVGEAKTLMANQPEVPAANQIPWVGVYSNHYGDTTPFLFDHEPSIDEVIGEASRFYAEFDEDRDSITIAEGCVAQGKTAAPADDLPPPEEAPELYVGVSEDGEVIGEWDERLRAASCRAVPKSSL